QSGGAVVTAIGAEPVGIDPCNPWALGSGMWGIVSLCYDSWTYLDRQQQIQPSLATSWSRPDETTVIVEMRQGVKYHGSERELTADDVVWNYERVTRED